jgi:ankyrin repeat protein
MIAVRLTESPMISRLLTSGASLSKSDSNGKTALDIAVMTNRTEIAVLLNKAQLMVTLCTLMKKKSSSVQDNALRLLNVDIMRCVSTMLFGY